jgi:hypothetical protein
VPGSGTGLTRVGLLLAGSLATCNLLGDNFDKREQHRADQARH